MNKPAGIASQGGTNIKLSIDSLAESYSNARLMHRIDRKVSGMLILGKTSQSCQSPITKKQYYAIVFGNPIAKTGQLCKKIKTSGQSQRLSDDGKPAFTNYEKVESVEKDGIFYSLLKIEIHTGRKHQIRVHCAQELGMPVVGDEKYGGGNKERIFLHAYSCKVNEKTFVAPFPDEFVKFLKDLGFKTFFK